jgi:hypothetical protein
MVLPKEKIPPRSAACPVPRVQRVNVYLYQGYDRKRVVAALVVLQHSRQELIHSNYKMK